MKRLVVIAGASALACLVSCTIVPGPGSRTTLDSTTEFRSRLGFTIALPANWFTLDPSVVDRQADQPNSIPLLSNLDPSMLHTALDRIRSGQYEYCFRQSPPAGFAENLTIRRRFIRFVDNPARLRRHCEDAPASFERAFGQPVSIGACELRFVAGQPASYLEVEGGIAGTWHFQYQIRESPETVIVITAGARTENVSEVRHEFESIIRSLHFDPPQ